ncbi:MAG: hypothetical protein ACO3EE_11525, partial [Flavobacteriales bacterium]
KFANDDFAVTSNLDIWDSKGINDTNPNFLTKNVPLNPIFFKATFNQEVSWTIRIDGKLSGAYKEIKGVGNTIDASNAIWQGDASSTEFFADNSSDTCMASLYVAGINTPVSSRKLVIKRLKSFHNVTNDGVRYLVVDDFDKGTMLGLPTGLTVGGLSSFSTDLADMGTPKAYLYNEHRMQGKNSLHMEGVDYNKNGWLASINHANLVEMISSANVANNIAATDPENFYVNLYIRGTGKANSSVEIKLYELDDVTSPDSLKKLVTKNTAVYDGNAQKTNDGWIYDITVDWLGWKLVSVPYSEFRVANDLNTGGAGNHVKEPWKITGLALSLLAYPAPGAEVSADVDFVVISEGGPFVPSFKNY